MISKTEFMNTNYHTYGNYVIPLLDIRLKKTDFFIKGKLDSDLLYAHAEKLYDVNIDKFL